MAIENCMFKSVVNLEVHTWVP